VISTIAGGAGGPGQARKINLGTAGVGVAFSSGSLYIGLGLSVRKVSPATGLLTMVAGTGEPGPLGDGGRALTASIDGGTAVTIDHAGNVLVAETGDNRIRAIAASTGTFYGQAMRAGHIYPIVGTGHRGFSGDGGPATAAQPPRPSLKTRRTWGQTAPGTWCSPTGATTASGWSQSRPAPTTARR
jgi:hypothetical protein